MSISAESRTPDAAHGRGPPRRVLRFARLAVLVACGLLGVAGVAVLAALVASFFFHATRPLDRQIAHRGTMTIDRGGMSVRAGRFEWVHSHTQITVARTVNPDLLARPPTILGGTGAWRVRKAEKTLAPLGGHDRRWWPSYERLEMPNSYSSLLSIPLWVPGCVLLVPGGMPVLLAWRRRRRAIRRQRTGLCTVCGFDLRATPDRCPECGATAASASTNVSGRSTPS